jgi:hypothetical protein
VPPRSWAGFDAEACPGRFQSVRKPAVPAYHEARLGELLAPVGQSIDSFRAGELDAFAVDHGPLPILACRQEIWKFCSLFQVEIAARAVLDQPTIDWWEPGAPRRP